MPSTASLGVQTINGQAAMLPLGRFFVTEIKLDRNSKITKLKLQDEFVRLLGPYESKLSYPTGTPEIFQEIVTMTGIPGGDAINLPDVSIGWNIRTIQSRRQARVYRFEAYNETNH